MTVTGNAGNRPPTLAFYEVHVFGGGEWEVRMLASRVTGTAKDVAVALEQATLDYLRRGAARVRRELGAAHPADMTVGDLWRLMPEGFTMSLRRFGLRPHQAQRADGTIRVRAHQPLFALTADGEQPLPRITAERPSAARGRGRQASLVTRPEDVPVRRTRPQPETQQRQQVARRRPSRFMRQLAQRFAARTGGPAAPVTLAPKAAPARPTAAPARPTAAPARPEAAPARPRPEFAQAQASAPRPLRGQVPRQPQYAPQAVTRPAPAADSAVPLRTRKRKDPKEQGPGALLTFASYLGLVDIAEHPAIGDHHED